MPCVKPTPAFRPANGGPLRFSPPNDGRAYNPIQVPCGTCELCREEQAREWAVRITHEASMHQDSCFITLTIDDKHLPPYGSLNYEDLQKFWKRIRKLLWKKYKIRLRYYAVGEYGDKSLRAHYHACVFGYAFTTNRTILRRAPTLLWTNDELIQAWGLGHVSVGALNYQTASYTASYIVKKLTSKQKYVRVDKETGELIPIEQPRSFMSRNIAKEWFKKFGKGVFDHDYVVIQGKRQKPPKAYDKWHKSSDPDFTVTPGGIAWRARKKNEQQLEKIKEKRKAEAKPQSNKDSHARALNARARAKQSKKSI